MIARSSSSLKSRGLGFPAWVSLIDQTGNYLLGHPALYDIWTVLYQSEFWRLTRFNHSRLLGALAISLALWVPVLLISYWLIGYYRRHWAERLKKTRLVSMLQSSRLIMILSRGGEGS